MSDRDLFSDPSPTTSDFNLLATPLVAKCTKCPATEYVDRPIHDGRSVRRDCAQCGWTLGFPILYGEEVGVSA